MADSTINTKSTREISAIGAEGVTPRERATLMVSVLIISLCALVYELIIATLSSYLLGDSVTQFSFTLGFFMFAMGLGALTSRVIRGSEVRWFITIEILTGLFGGVSACLLYAVFTLGESTYYYLAMLIVTIGVGGCIGMEIPLLTRIVSHRGSLSKALADILSLDYLGSLLGSLAFPVILLPLLGVTQTAFLMGMLNVFVAGLCLQLFRTRLTPYWARGLMGVWAVSMVIMLLGAALSNEFVRLFEQRLYASEIIHSQQTAYQRIIITRDNEDVRLFLDGDLRLSSRDESRYHEALVHPVMSMTRSHETVLVLGGGDGTAVRELLKYEDVQRIIVVELDPEMTALARTSPLREINGDAFSDPRVTVVNTDAYRYLEDSSDVYPVIIIDLPNPATEGLSKLYSQQFYRLLHKHLAPDGAFITQATSPSLGREAFWMIANTIGASDFQTLPLHTYVPSMGDWGFVIGTKAAMPTPHLADSLTLTHLTPDVLAEMQVFDAAIAPVETNLNTLDRALLVEAYQRVQSSQE